MKLDEFCAKLNARLAELTSTDERLHTTVQALAKAFRVSHDEVALLVLQSNNPNMLCFLWPQKLGKAGCIPLSAHNALAAKTVRGNRSFINNQFAAEPHAVIFEQVRLDTVPQQPIQKIISVPLIHDSKANGAIQISRKGADEKSVADFVQNDVKVLEEIARVLAGYF